MKTCPQCQKQCEDNAIVCPNCGYLFSATQAPGEQGSAYREPQGGFNSAPQDGPGYPSAIRPKDGFATASMVLGIVGVVLSFCVIGIIPAIIGLILGIISKVRIRRDNLSGGGMALAGIILSAVAIVIFVIIVILAVAFYKSPSFIERYREALEQYQSSRP